ncbi:MAG TPA: beta-ketoacyl synthase N-terminal-like domain-containing protein [Acidimicrobiales bacterium]|nr:beta-ketoacyl synthase N-terminal-like domain-containing protein [Acidimicrobiales bacterium]
MSGRDGVASGGAAAGTVPPDEPVAVVGLGCVFPGAADVGTFWRNVVEGVDAITPVPPDRGDPEFFAGDGSPPALDRFPHARGGFVPDDGLWFEPGRFGVMPVAVEGAEPDQLLALRTAAVALDDAGMGEDLPRSRVGVILGRGGYLTPGLVRLDQRVRTANQLLTTLRDLLPEVDDERLVAVKEAFVEQVGEPRPDAVIGLVPNLAASRVANRLDLGGPAYTVDAACASALVAVDAALGELRSGRCEVVLAGAVHHAHDVTLWSVFSQLGALSPTGSIRPFSRDADGILIGEGTGMLVLERLERAERLDHRVYAVVGGAGVASDGRGASLTAPSVAGQVLALERAYRSSGVDPATVGLVEGHGTATPAGDQAELDTIRQVFGPGDGGLPGVLGSVKSMIGHAMPAAAAAGLIKAVLAVHHGVLPPTLHAEEPHEAVAATRFRLLGSAEPWEGPGPRRAGVDAFGFGGINAHVVLEQHGHVHRDGSRIGGGRRRPRRGSEVPGVGSGARADRVDAVLLAGRDTAEVAARLAAVAGGGTPPPGGQGGPARLAVVDPTPRRLEVAARALAKGRPWRGLNDVWFEPEGLVAEGGRVAFLLPGVDVAVPDGLEPVAAAFARPLPEPPGGCTPLEAQGRRIFAAGRLLHGVLGDLGVVADDVAGHSLGEWTGAVVSELIPPGHAERFLDDLVPGWLEVPEVAYLALGCGADVAEVLVDGLDGTSVSHDNCPHQSVVCGPEREVDVARRRAVERGVMAQELPFRSGFHSPAFLPYLDELRRRWALTPFQAPRVPMWSATTAARCPDDADAVRHLAAEHLVRPVRFRPLVEAMHADGVRVFVQLGAGSLAGFVGDTLRGRPHLALSAHAPRRPGLAQVARVAAALWVEGVDVDTGRVLRSPPSPPRSVEPPRGAAPGSSRGGRPEPDRVPAPGRAPAPPGPRLRLDLGAPLVRLPASSRLVAGAVAGPPPAPGPAGALHPADGAPTAAGGVPLAPRTGAGALASAHEALVGEVLAASRAVEDALAGRGGGRPRPARLPAGDPPRGPGDGRRPAPPPGRHRPPRPEGGSTGADQGPPPSAERVVRVDLAHQPWLGDHCFFRQAPGSDPSDRFPVVPMTMMVEMLADAARRLARDRAPGQVVVRVEDVRALRWLPAAPPTDVTVRATMAGPHRVEVALEGYARATVVLAPAPPPAPAPAAGPLTGTRPSPLGAREIYDRHWMFHGPAFRAVRRIGELGGEGVDGVVEALPAPGATLDGAGQLYGWWVMATASSDFLALPQSIERVELFGPLPPAGARLAVSVRIAELSERTVRADLELVHGGRVVVRIDGWVDRRFDSDAELWRMCREPEHHLLSTVGPGGILVVDERWRDSASRELIARRYLNAGERVAYEALNPRAQRHWLLGRIAAKDAVRRSLWDEGHGPVFPAEITVANEPGGRPAVVAGPGAGRALSIGHTSWAGVACCAPGGTGVGVDVEVVEPRGDVAGAVVLSAGERALLPPGDEDEWLTRAWAAKEAAAKAAGSGLGGRPRDFPVRAVEGERVLVGARWVGTARAAAPLQVAWGGPGRPPAPAGADAPAPERKDYVVAWTCDT